MNKLLDEIKNEVSRENDDEDFEDIFWSADKIDFMDDVAERYAKRVTHETNLKLQFYKEAYESLVKKITELIAVVNEKL